MPTVTTCDYCEKVIDDKSSDTVFDYEDEVESVFCDTDCADEQARFIADMAAFQVAHQ